MEKGDESAQAISQTGTLSESDSNIQEAHSSDSGRSTPSKHIEGTSGQPSNSASRPVAPLSLRRQIALALELSKDGKFKILNVLLFTCSFRA